MSIGQIQSSIEEGIKYLKTLSLYKGKGFKPIGKHSSDFIKVAMKNRHIDLYRVAIKNGDYEIILFDDSIFQFSINNNILRFAYIQNPNIFLTKEDFLIENICSQDDLLNMTKGECDELIGSINDEEYEQFLNEQDFNLQANILRYDYDSKSNLPLIHSQSHFHIGLNQNIRIPCSRIITPFMFILFSVKHTYYNEWKNSFNKVDKFHDLLNNSKSKCDNLLNWEIEDGFELYLS